MKRYCAGMAAEERRRGLHGLRAAALGALLIAPFQVFAAGLPPQHDAVAEHDNAVIAAGACSGRNCAAAPPPSRPPCRPRAPYSAPRSNISMREMWELITRGAPMPGTDYYYYRMYEYQKGRIYRPRRCGS
jgi:hypothetical protein